MARRWCGAGRTHSIGAMSYLTQESAPKSHTAPRLPPGHSQAWRVGLAWLALFVAANLLAACATWRVSAPDAPLPDRLAAVLPADVLILGEQHDAAAHHELQRETIEALAAHGQLAALALEMAESGRSTADLRPSASEAQVQAALEWHDKAWPWSTYGPVVMSAVRAGVPVLGANLPRARMKDAMVDVSLDVQLNARTLAAQRKAVREGHCDLLPASQIEPMTRIQIARDREMAHTVAQAVVPGRTVVLVTGSGHAIKSLGVPQHLPTELRVRSVGLVAGDGHRPGFDALWHTPAMPEQDYCAGVKVPPARKP